MFAKGHKRTSRDVRAMSGLNPKADVHCDATKRPARVVGQFDCGGKSD
jgi:hypothetical protein